MILKFQIDQFINFKRNIKPKISDFSAIFTASQLAQSNNFLNIKMNRPIINQLESAFKKHFGTNPKYFRAPGRINLIGEHTDYNEGFVLPAAIDKAMYFATARNDLNKLRLYSLNYDEYIEVNIDVLVKIHIQWVNYLIGVAAQFVKRGYPLSGIDCAFGGDIPFGAGLSSSAALECGFALSINEEFGFGIAKKEMALMSQTAEHEYAGVLCGIMDQFASIFGKHGQVFKLDCKTLNFEYYPFKNEQYELYLCDTQVKHSLASSEYNQRREECEKGLSVIKKKYPNINSLRDTTPEILENVKDHLDDLIFRRCYYVIHENLRVTKACASLLKNDLISFGKLMYETHVGLSKQYDVSCIELDTLVEIATEIPEVIGSRMMGGGFGGCTLNIVKKEYTENFIETIQNKFYNRTGLKPLIYHVRISNGAHSVEL